MKSKCIYLSDEDIELLKTIKKEKGFSSDGQTVSFLLKKYTSNKEELAIKIREELEANYLPKERVRWGVQTAEQNSTMILDAINTLLWSLKINADYKYDEIPHPVLKSSREQLDKKIAYFKQKSDERKAKQGNKK